MVLPLSWPCHEGHVGHCWLPRAVWPGLLLARCWYCMELAHTNVHTGEKFHECNLCEYAFSEAIWVSASDVQLVHCHWMVDSSPSTLK